MDAYRFSGGTAVVTGAASGIGAALAAQLAARGSNLVLVDRDKERLDGVADGVRRDHPGLAVDTYVVDLSDDAATAEAADRSRPRTRGRRCWSTTRAWPSAAGSTR